MNTLTTGIIKIGDYKISKETLKEILRLARIKYPDRKVKLEINFDEKLYQHMLNNPHYYSYPGPIIEIYVEGLTCEERKEFKDYKEKGYFPISLDYTINKLLDPEDIEEDLQIEITNYYKL